MPGFKSQLHHFLALFNFSVPLFSQERVPTLQNYSTKWIYVKPLEQYSQYLDKNKCSIGVINQMLFWELTQPFFFQFEETSDTGEKQWVSQGPRETTSHWVSQQIITQCSQNLRMRRSCGGDHYPANKICSPCQLTKICWMLLMGWVLLNASLNPLGILWNCCSYSNFTNEKTEP